jgi:hypothetical protein
METTGSALQKKSQRWVVWNIHSPVEVSGWLLLLQTSSAPGSELGS